MEDTLTVPATNKKWYTLQVRTHMEKSVLEELTRKVDQHGLSEVFGQIIVPEEQVIEVKNGQQRRSARKLYPGYVFVEMAFNDRAWHLIKSCKKVTGFVGGTDTRPASVPVKDMQRILEQMQASCDAPVPKMSFEVGETVLITDGPFKDFEGDIEDVRYNQNKLKVRITIFGRATLMDVEFTHVAKKT